ncbi:MAG: hypothetical protein CMJ58_01620 [Planctomycetaceae bacterium]|nr:hypothetical protein [Planctomycetaceae bacterium]
MIRSHAGLCRSLCRMQNLAALALAWGAMTPVAHSDDSAAPPAEPSAEQSAEVDKKVIGATAAVKVVQGDLTFPARVDTGATTTSLHVEQWRIEGGSADMTENVGKVIRFCIKDHRGEMEWLERKIVELATIKTSVQEEQRYKVRVKLSVRGVEKCVLVSLKDRSHMEYPVLLGRNFLEGDFLVDVEKNPRTDPKKLSSKTKGEQRS